MSEYPANHDLYLSAEKARAEADDKIIKLDAVGVIYRALLAERERCLNVALGWATDVRNPHGSRITAGHIAADIRNPKT